MSQYDQLTVLLSIEISLESLYVIISLQCSVSRHGFVFIWLRSAKIIQLYSRPFTFSTYMFRYTLDSEGRYVFLQICSFYGFSEYVTPVPISFEKKSWLRVMFWKLYNLLSFLRFFLWTLELCALDFARFIVDEYDTWSKQ
jgi:hypothetical protein